MAPNLPLPPQISTDPAVNASAMAWAGQLVDALQKIISGSAPSGVDADKLDGLDSTAFLTQALADVKGDLIAASGADTFARLAVGSNGRVLVADSSQTQGLVYALLTNTNIDAAAAIAYSKLALAASVKNSDLIGSGGTLADTPPGRELTYDQITANVTVSATTEAGATTIITATAFTFDGTTAVNFEFYAARIITSANAGDDVTLYLFEDGVIVGIIGQLVNPGAAGLGVPVLCRLRKTPTSGAHTYSIRAKRTTANGTVLAGAGGTGTFLPAFLRISKA